LGRTPIAISNAKRSGQTLSPQGIDDEVGGYEEEFWGISSDTILPGHLLTRVVSNPRLFVRANFATGNLQVIAGVALTSALTGEKVHILRRGIHPGVIYDTAGVAGNRAQLSSILNSGQAESVGPNTVPNGPHQTVGIQLETATGAPLRASTYVACWF